MILIVKPTDGKWHLWDGGVCPVHRECMVHVVWHDPDSGALGRGFGEAGGMNWQTVIRFCVEEPQEQPKPRSLWLVEYPANAHHGAFVNVHFTEADADRWRGNTPCKTTRWIEVLP